MSLRRLGRGYRESSSPTIEPTITGVRLKKLDLVNSMVRLYVVAEVTDTYNDDSSGRHSLTSAWGLHSASHNAYAE